jgi:mannose-6-phosphate isomerase-like protein (cupin superfamily)
MHSLLNSITNIHRNSQFLIEDIISKTKRKASILTIAKNNADLCYTKNYSQLVFVIEGKGGITIDGDSTLIEAGYLIKISPNKVRTISNINSSNLKIISLDF